MPIVVRREIDGFILNRLQAVLLSEAFRLVGEGYVSPQDLDKTLADGLGLPLDRVVIRYVSTAYLPYDSGVGGSRVTISAS